MLLSAFTAVLPALILMGFMVRQNRIPKDPPLLLLTLLLLGAASGPAAGYVESFLEEPLTAPFLMHPTVCLFVSNMIGVALVEEGFKYLIFRLITWRSRHFICRMNGILYAACVSCGFAALENALYVLSGEPGIVFFRILAAPGHFLYALLMGGFYSVAKEQELAGRRGKSFLLRMAGLSIATGLHGLYDFILSTQAGGILLIPVLVGIFASIILILIKIGRQLPGRRRAAVRGELVLTRNIS